MLAADPLLAAGIPMERVRELLPGIEPARIPVRIAPRWLRALWVGDVGAMATPRSILTARSPLVEDPARLAGLMAHELAHVEQWRRLGVVRFLVRYLSDYLGNRLGGMSHQEAYAAISLEQEAEEVRRRLIG